MVAARSAKHVRARQMCLLEDASQELQRASKTVTSGLRRMPASLKQQVCVLDSERGAVKFEPCALCCSHSWLPACMSAVE